MKVGLYFGSFNPVHVGHLIIANHILNESGLDRLWFVVSPHNPFKAENGLLNEFHRLQLLRVATEEDPRIRVSDIEFSLPRPSYTVTTLAYLEEKYPGHRFSIILGSDSLQNLPKWKNAEVIIKNYPLIVYPRPGFPVQPLPGAQISVCEAPLLEISSTRIREWIAEGKSVRYLLPEKVLEEIEKGGYYKKGSSNK